jgi:RNA:NAD 2'-phosphotransferase (TPT1/KptA family)
MHKLRVSFAELQNAVMTNDKERFQLEEEESPPPYGLAID